MKGQNVLYCYQSKDSGLQKLGNFFNFFKKTENLLIESEMDEEWLAYNTKVNYNA